MRNDLTPPGGSDLRLAYNLNSCNDTWNLGFTTSICVSWNGSCTTDDSRDYYFQVYGYGTSNSCADYRITVTFATVGNVVTGCN
jgi:hypothetical protein